MRITKKRFWQPGAGWALARAYHTDATALFLPYRQSVTPAWRFFCILGAMKQTLSHAAPSRCDRDHRIAVSADALRLLAIKPHGFDSAATGPNTARNHAQTWPEDATSWLEEGNCND